MKQEEKNGIIDLLSIITSILIIFSIIYCIPDKYRYNDGELVKIEEQFIDKSIVWIHDVCDHVVTVWNNSDNNCPDTNSRIM